MLRKVFVFLILIGLLTACGTENGVNKDSIEVIHFGDAGWDSIRIHNQIARLIIEEGYGYQTSETIGTETATFQALAQGDIQVIMEVWTDNIRPIYDAALAEGTILKASTNYDDNTQGLYVPTYVIKGDKERDIQALAPNLKTVEDLLDYADVFIDPEERSKGRIVGAPSSWVLSEYLEIKMATYGLDEKYNYVAPGSDSAIVASLAGAYAKGEPWVGYYWSPTWVTASYDLTLLEDHPYDEEIWNATKGTEFIPNDVVVAIHADLQTQAPEIVTFLKNYKTSSNLTEEALIYLKEEGVEAEEAAYWWMREHEEIWTAWVSEEAANKGMSKMFVGDKKI